MNTMYVIAGILSLGLLIYCSVALLKPEKLLMTLNGLVQDLRLISLSCWDWQNH